MHDPPVPTDRQRVDSAAHVASKLAADGARSALAALDQRGGARVRLPRAAGDALEAVTVNTAGGLTGDDRIEWRARAGAGSRLVVSSAACEKLYRSDGPDARQRTVLRAEAGARLDWLPQETIAYEGSRLVRRLEADLDADATLLACEALVLGRAAMGERVRRGRFRDDWRVRRDGRLVHAEALALGDDVEAARADPAGLGRWSALATVLLCDASAPREHERLVERLRARVAAALGDVPDTASGGAGDVAVARASALPGRVVFRVLATDSATLRRALLPALETLGGGRALPRVWHV